MSFKEASTSSKIEGTRTNIEEVFLPEAEVKLGLREDWREVRNYIDAMNAAISQLSDLPLSNRLIRYAHRIKTIQVTLKLKDQINTDLIRAGRLQENTRIICQRLFAQPMITINEATKILRVSFPAASRVINKLEELEILEEISGQTRNRIFAFRAYLNLFK